MWLNAFHQAEFNEDVRGGQDKDPLMSDSDEDVKEEGNTLKQKLSIRDWSFNIFFSIRQSEVL